MPERSETIAYCHSCGNPMNVAAVAPFANVACPTCGKHTRVKREFGPYTLVRRHAVGGMSMVFVAQDNTLDREVALKILSEEFSADERRIAAFEEEARITASFSHPHVVRVLRTGKAFGRFYIAMEFVPGGHFEQQIKERGKIPEVEMLPLAIEVAQGLKAAHSAGLIHRDVKPGNILLDAEGRAKLVDFGLALVTHGGNAQATELWATPYYVPPETIEGAAEDFRSDIYAFGATVYHALAGVPPCGEETMSTDLLREAKKHIKLLQRECPDISEATCKIVNRAMAYYPKDRFSSYDEMIGLLEIALKRLKSGAPAAETPGSAARRRADRLGVVVTLAVAGLVLLSAVAGGIWWVTRKDAPREVQTPLAPATALVIPDSSATAATASTDIAKSYREARAAVAAGEFAKAADAFVKLRENPAVQEPTRSWAGVEAVAATYLDGRSTDARNEAMAATAHLRSVPEEARIGGGLIEILGKLSELPAIPAKEIDAAGSAAPQVMAWLLAGLKDWEQGLPGEAAGYFAAVAAARISADEPWLALYQNLAKDYLADQGALSAAVFEKFPADAAGCHTAIAELNQILGGLKTRGRARFNVRAWQLDLAKHAKLLAAPQPGEADVPESAGWDPIVIQAKLGEFSKDCRFSEAAIFLKSLPAGPQDAARASLLAVAEASAVFLVDLDADLAKEALAGEFPLKSGELIRRISINAVGGITATDAEGRTRAAGWGDFTPDALIALHRIFVKNPKSELERLRRHERAISYDWLAGNRERALAAAAVLSQESPDFKQRWETTASGLPSLGSVPNNRH